MLLLCPIAWAAISFLFRLVQRLLSRTKQASFATDAKTHRAAERVILFCPMSEKSVQRAEDS